MEIVSCTSYVVHRKCDYYGYLVAGISLHCSVAGRHSYYKLICNCNRIICSRIWDAGHEFPIKADIKARYHRRFGSKAPSGMENAHLPKFPCKSWRGCECFTIHLRHGSDGNTHRKRKCTRTEKDTPFFTLDTQEVSRGILLEESLLRRLKGILVLSLRGSFQLFPLTYKRVTSQRNNRYQCKEVSLKLSRKVYDVKSRNVKKCNLFTKFSENSLIYIIAHISVPSMLEIKNNYPQSRK